jgi:hypothetical protein
MLSIHVKGIVMNKLVLAGSLSILTATVAFSYNITHPDLKNAHDLADQAIKQIQAAQHTEETGGVNFGGHAAKALEHLAEAKTELIQADQYNNANQKKKPK